MKFTNVGGWALEQSNEMLRGQLQMEKDDYQLLMKELHKMSQEMEAIKFENNLMKRILGDNDLL